MDFTTWLERIDHLAAYDGFVAPGESYVKKTGRECWREMYEDGLTPSEAWAEEVDAARSMR